MAEEATLDSGTRMADLTQIGSPTPNGWQVQQVLIGDKMFVKLVIASPTGLDVHFMDGNEAQRLASNLRKAGRSAAAGTWNQGSPDPEAVYAEDGPISGAGAEGLADPARTENFGR